MNQISSVNYLVFLMWRDLENKTVYKLDKGVSGHFRKIMTIAAGGNAQRAGVEKDDLIYSPHVRAVKVYLEESYDNAEDYS